MLSTNLAIPSRPFEPGLPASLLADAELPPSAAKVAAALLAYAARKDHCWPSNGRLATDVGMSSRTVRRAISALVARGYLRAERSEPTRGNATCRVLILTWRAGRAGRPRATPFFPADVPGGGPPLSPKEGGLGSHQEDVTVTPQTRPDPEGRQDRQTPPPPFVEGKATPDLLEQLPGRPDLAEATACRLAAENRDHASLPYYRARCGEVARGQQPLERLTEAARAAKAATTAARPGAIFVCFWRGWIPRPKPTTSTTVSTPEMIAARELARVEADAKHQDVLEYLREAAGNPANPWHKFRRRGPHYKRL